MIECCFIVLLQVAAPPAPDWDALTDKLYQALRYDDLDTFNFFLNKAEVDLARDYANLRFKPRGDFIGGDLLRALVYSRANRVGTYVVATMRAEMGPEPFVDDFLNLVDGQDGLTFLGWLKIHVQSRLGNNSAQDLEELRNQTLVLKRFRNLGAKIECELDPEFECDEPFDSWLMYIAEDLRTKLE